ncbi:helix-turn-helix domain-containing protein [Bradyrhizobium sp. 190]|uniref:helix-turn-helix domain-containing protein n=1 Tax=Bradyrhizobium sp. 190 TaxID=2782658 RepID=UPI001FF84F8F|nr:helix-turn-helix transcriptional regulator [Bradyrhizobium sp. 190]
MTYTRLYYKQFERLTLPRLRGYNDSMTDGALDGLCQAFGKLVRKHRERLDGMTQEKLGILVGLSRTSITNIEKGRQHVSLHQLFAIAEALEVAPSLLLPAVKDAAGARAKMKLPPGTDQKIAAWAQKLVGE